MTGYRGDVTLRALIAAVWLIGVALVVAAVWQTYGQWAGIGAAGVIIVAETELMWLDQRDDRRRRARDERRAVVERWTEPAATRDAP
jgi:hypothetical protein